MPAYLGTLGRLVAFKAPKVVPVEPDRNDTIERSLEGVNSVQVGLKAPRSWSVAVPTARSEDVASVLAIGAGEFGIGPFVWVNPAAAALNLLTPDVSICGESAVVGATISQGGPLNLPDGSVVGRSLLNSNTAQNMYFGSAIVPVIPGQPVTSSAYVVGSGSKVGLNFHDAAGAYITNAISTGTGTAGAATRLSVTATAPSNAASCVPFGSSTVQGARPAVTWTPNLRPWSLGDGCPKAHVSNIPHTVSPILRHELSFTITELG